ncbi:Wzz/FepE/Etk N-terminal domain-containing protein [Candidatus Neomarinimicrobiota bacterium]
MNNSTLRIITDNEIDLRALSKVIWNGKKLVLLITGIITFASVVYSLLITPLYMATITLYPSSSSGGGASLGQLQGIAASFGFNLGGTETVFNIPDIINSRRLRSTLLHHPWNSKDFDEAVDLITYWELNDTSGFSLNPMVWITDLLSSGEGKRNLALKWEERGLEQLEKRIAVRETRSGLVVIRLWMEEPRMAANIANYFYEAIVDYTVNVHNMHARLNREFIDRRLNEVKGELKQAEDELKKFREHNRRVIDSPELLLEQERLIREVKIQTEVYIMLQQQYELARIEEVSETPSVVFLDEAQPAVKKDKPKRKKLVIMAFLFGLIISPVAVVARHLYHQRS